MPFTPTHIAAVVPIRMLFKSLPFSALAIGSMVPDIPLFYPVSSYLMTHSLIGLFSNCLPIGLLAYFVFQFMVKRPFVLILPKYVQLRMGSHASVRTLDSIKELALVCCALLVGASSHVLWDAFTHYGRWGTEMFAILRDDLHLSRFAVPGYKLFQYGSSLVCLPVMGMLFVWKLQKTVPRDVTCSLVLSTQAKCAVWGVLLVVPMLSAIGAMRGLSFGATSVFHGIVAGGSCLGYLVFGGAFVFSLATWLDAIRSRRRLS